MRFPTQKAVLGLLGGTPQKVSHIGPAFHSFMWDSVSTFPTGMVKTGGLCGILLFPCLRGRAAAMWERRPAPAARGMTGSAIPCPAPLHYMTRKLASPCFQGAQAPPSHPLDGRETDIPPAEQARSALRSRCGMQFPRRTRTAKPQARATRAARRRCADTHALRCQDNKQHSKTADGGVRTRVPID